jgi:RNA polymerase sigma-70 factor (ECF subfamily)
MTDDNHLIRAFQKGDAGAFRELYARYRDRAYFFAFALSGDRHSAEEAAQEAFIDFIGKVKNYKPRGSFKAYLFTAVRWRLIDGRRKVQARRETALPEDLDIFEGGMGPEGAREPELGPLISRALFSLPRAQREVIALKIYDNMTFAEIATVIGAGENTVASRFRYGLAKLKQKLERIAHHG